MPSKVQDHWAQALSCLGDTHPHAASCDPPSAGLGPGRQQNLTIPACFGPPILSPGAMSMSQTLSQARQCRAWQWGTTATQTLLNQRGR